jgi:putative heme-binding domain-containing protein
MKTQKHILATITIAAAILAGSSMLHAAEDAPGPNTPNLNVAEGFKVERLYSVPKEEQGSWVSMTFDDRGRIITSDQYGSLYRITLPPLTQTSPVEVEKIDVDIGHAQGLLYAFDSLYVVVNAEEHGGRGLYRIRDTNKDDRFDQVELLKKFEENGGEHGPHAVILGPDKESIYVIVGDQTALPEYDLSRVPEAWGEDQLLPRIYGRAFMKGVLAPRGWIARTDPDGGHWEIIATGFRNEYDAAFNREGELFTFDSDMQWDLNTPWYRPNRVNHVTSGAEFGWRNGSAKWPDYYPDSLPAIVNIGPGSPTGVTFGYGARFPAKYQDAFYICDWTFGKLYAVHMTPSGSTYKAEFEEFITGTPLPFTDLEVNPHDQALYFLIGGRRVQSALYRVTYTGDESTQASKRNRDGASARALRQKLESYHGVKDPAAISKSWPHLGSADRFLRYAARVAVEHQDTSHWQEKALKESNPQRALAALLALSRMGDTRVQPRLLQALDQIRWDVLSATERLELVRIYSLAFIRMGAPDNSARASLTARFEAIFPTASPKLNNELCQLLVYLQSPSVAKKAIQLLLDAPTQEEQIAYAKSLRLLKTGWTPQLRRDYFSWFSKAENFRGGASFSKFVEAIKNDAVKRWEGEKAELQSILDASPEPQTPAETLAAMSQLAGRQFSRQWTVDELEPILKTGLKGGRDYDRGRSLFGAVACYSCHQFDGEGGIIGPDLTESAGRFTHRDLLESVVEPSKSISDQFNAIVITKKDGSIVTGRIANHNGDIVSLITDLYDPGSMVAVDRNEIKSIEESKVSMMPSGLINLLKEDEILDLMAFLLSRGDLDNSMFK